MFFNISIFVVIYLGVESLFFTRFITVCALVVYCYLYIHNFIYRKLHLRITILKERAIIWQSKLNAKPAADNFVYCFYSVKSCITV